MENLCKDTKVKHSHELIHHVNKIKLPYNRLGGSCLTDFWYIYFLYYFISCMPVKRGPMR